MKTKIKKDWFGREKSTEELHHDSKLWMSEIRFIKDEIRFLEHLLSANYIDCIAIGLHKKIEESVNQISTEKKVGTTLINLINEHEKILSELIKNESATSNTNFIENHKKLEIEVNAYINKYKDLKQQIFKIVENVMRKKEQKKLPNSKEIPKLLDR
ncbi:hypothetical protein [Lutibacter sp.]|uniref:hypothetical protein n=1 Tax=Lutibacter sp. TaxID=1925666 RepID=UPI003567441E